MLFSYFFYIYSWMVRSAARRNAASEAPTHDQVDDGTASIAPSDTPSDASYFTARWLPHDLQHELLLPAQPVPPRPPRPPPPVPHQQPVGFPEISADEERARFWAAYHAALGALGEQQHQQAWAVAAAAVAADQQRQQAWTAHYAQQQHGQAYAQQQPKSHGQAYTSTRTWRHFRALGAAAAQEPR